MFCVGRAMLLARSSDVGVTFSASTSREHLLLHGQQIVEAARVLFAPDRLPRDRILELDDDADLRVVALHRSGDEQVEPSSRASFAWGCLRSTPSIALVGATVT